MAEAYVLGIDAAWTDHNPSGVALAKIVPREKLIVCRVARSYTEFLLDESDWTQKAVGTHPNIRALIKKVGNPRVVTLDIPLAHTPIIGRRASDDAITRKYGCKWAGTHSPSKKAQPMLLSISQSISGQFEELGWTLATCETKPGSHQFLETYPHPAIIELMGLQRRLPYKVAKMRHYWKSESPPERWRMIAVSLEGLRSALATYFRGVEEHVPSAHELLSSHPRSKTTALSSLETILDALVCAYVACQYLRRNCVPFGNQDAAIWIPIPSGRVKARTATAQPRGLD